MDQVLTELKDVFDRSPQGLYVYLDDENKACNERFAEMLGYDSASEWDRRGSFTDLYVDAGSAHTLVSAYRDAMEHCAASTISVSWKRADGAILPSTVMLVPIEYGGELMALHFVSSAPSA